MAPRTWRTGWLLTAAAVVVVAGILAPAAAWARYGSAGAETNTFATHVLLAPGEPSCGAISLFSVPLSWTAPTDASFVSSYDIGTATTSGGPYTYVNVGTARSTSVEAGLGNYYYVVRTEDHLWRGANSAERHVLGVGLVATCP